MQEEGSCATGKKVVYESIRESLVDFPFKGTRNRMQEDIDGNEVPRPHCGCVQGCHERLADDLAMGIPTVSRRVSSEHGTIS